MDTCNAYFTVEGTLQLPASEVEDQELEATEAHVRAALEELIRENSDEDELKYLRVYVDVRVRPEGWESFS